MASPEESDGPSRPTTPGAALEALTAPLRSRTDSFPFYALGGLLYLVGAVLIIYGVPGTLASVAEVVFLLAGSGVVIYAYLIDRGTLNAPWRPLP